MTTKRRCRSDAHGGMVEVEVVPRRGPGGVAMSDMRAFILEEFGVVIVTRRVEEDSEVRHPPFQNMDQPYRSKNLVISLH
jgi:hypothetical protein